ncbi:MAG: T9SS type A sorting domain-containing protein [Phycisphaerae bacterium]|nr:T9SS type A sorting domain-containing protein [Saprospiraceae bacterium]
MRITNTLFCLLFTGLLSGQSTISGSIQSGGLTRDYLLYIPAAYTGNTAVPLVFNLHGYTSNNTEQLFYADFRPIADTANFLIVLPNGTLDAQGNRFWNTFLGNSNVDDVGCMRDLLNTLQANYNIDANRVYSTGMSNGGFMSYSLACQLNDRIAAIASVTGSMIQSKLNACNPARPVPVMEIHGTADNTVPYNGSPLSTFVAIPTLVAKWVDFNNCNPTPSITQVPNTNTSDGCTAERQLFTGGDHGSTVEHYKVISGGHTWPGAAFSIGVTNQDFSACKEIWRFFRQYRLDQLSATNTPEAIESHWTVFPNPAQDYLVLQSKDQRPVQGVQVFDALGRLQQTISPSAGGQIKMEMATWAVGVYWVVIEQEWSVARVKVVKAGR